MVMIAGGNRIIGGIGAPGGGMSEAFSTGAGSALDRRQTKQAMDETAQAMRMREQQFQWSIEDRAAAQKRAAAAAAASAAAQGRRQAAMAGVMAAEPFFKLGAQPGAGAAPAAPPSAGVALPRSMGTVAPAPVAAGGGGSAPAQPMAGVVARATPSGVIETPSAPLGRPGDFAARATQYNIAMEPTKTRIGEQIRTGAAGAQPFTPAIGALGEAEENVRRARRRYEGDPTGRNQQALLDANRALEETRAAIAAQQTAAESAATYLSDPEYSTRDALAYEGPEAGTVRGVAPTTVTIRGPNGPVTVPTVTATATATGASGAGAASAPPPPAVAPTAPGDLAFPGAAPMGVEPTTPLSFGPRLGAVPSAAEQFLADVGMAPAGQVDLEALAASYNSPLYDPMFAQLAEQQRAAFVFAAQDAAARGDIGGYLDAAAKVREQEMMILTQQLMVGLDEAKNFNSPQRMSQVLSMVYGGADVFVAPKGNGLADIYLDGAPYQMDADLDAVASHVRSMIDGEYRSQVAAAAAERAQADLEVEKQVRIDRGRRLAETEQKIVEQALRDEGLLPQGDYKYEQDATTGNWIVWSGDAIVRQYVPFEAETGSGTVVTLQPVNQ